MQNLISFTNVTLNGFFAGPNGDLGWAHTRMRDPEWDAFVADNAKSGGTLLLGRVTYDIMASYWPTPQAVENDPVVAEGMNNLSKVVFSRTLDRPSWKNTTLAKGDIVEAVRKMKQESGPGMAILGSGTIVSQLSQARLIDEYQVVVNPVALGDGKTLFAGIKDSLSLKLTKSRAFGNGNVLLRYEPAG